MKFFVAPFLLFVNICPGQGWEIEVVGGVSGYNGDLTQKLISLKTIRAAANLNLKCNLDNTVVLRAGIALVNVI
ncbi:MAG: hypothetical protein ABIO55_05720 [Ginsengibacter sp.]